MSELTLWLGALLTGIALIRLLTVEEPLSRLIALNITGGGTLMILVGLAVRSEAPDPVPQALALTGIVITVAFTGVGLVLLRAAHEELADPDDPDDTEDTEGAAGTGEQESR